ncbi:hypothetical protein CEXT_512481 [Caerostris extrusa]|uniref:Uncharacterized protein n=1 Tax=Caerostris extrusa TaxID=172846 RepID=A0AAV4THB6_CAEEX|nr:hypothetical protein CEXT_512481 [Caerostris extrusa]
MERDAKKKIYDGLLGEEVLTERAKMFPELTPSYKTLYIGSEDLSPCCPVFGDGKYLEIDITGGAHLKSALPTEIVILFNLGINFHQSI